MAMAAHNGHGPQEQSAKPALASAQEAMDDPLQKLAKQCDTISGDEEKTGRAGQRKNGQMQQNGHATEGGMPKGALAGQPKVGNGKAKSPHKVRNSVQCKNLHFHCSNLTRTCQFAHQQPQHSPMACCHPIRPSWRQ